MKLIWHTAEFLAIFFGTIFVITGITGLWLFCFDYHVAAAMFGKAALASFCTVFATGIAISIFTPSGGSKTYL